MQLNVLQCTACTAKSHPAQNVSSATVENAWHIRSWVFQYYLHNVCILLFYYYFIRIKSQENGNPRLKGILCLLAVLGEMGWGG